MTTTTELVECTNCGRHGWHETEKCPELSRVAIPVGFHVPEESGPDWYAGLFGGGILNRCLEWESADGAVVVEARQLTDGTITNAQIVVIHALSDVTRSPEGARRFARSLMAAADKLEGLRT